MQGLVVIEYMEMVGPKTHDDLPFIGDCRRVDCTLAAASAVSVDNCSPGFDLERFHVLTPGQRRHRHGVHPLTIEE